MLNAFHVVRCASNGMFRTYAIYRNNVEFLKPAGDLRIGKKAAYEIARILNRSDRFSAK